MQESKPRRERFEDFAERRESRRQRFGGFEQSHPSEFGRFEVEPNFESFKEVRPALNRFEGPEVFVEEVDGADEGEHYACLLPVAPGHCKAFLTKWYFNIQTGQCEYFYYTGCAGNANNFATWEECTASCPGRRGQEEENDEFQTEDVRTLDESDDDVIIMTSTVFPETEEEERQAQKEALEGTSDLSSEDVTTTTEVPAEPEVRLQEAEAEEDVQEDAVRAEEVPDTHAAAGPSSDVSTSSPSTLNLTRSTEYTILIVVLGAVGLAVVVLVIVSIVHLYKKLHRTKKERVLEAVINNHLYGELPKPVYTSHSAASTAAPSEVGSHGNDYVHKA